MIAPFGTAKDGSAHQPNPTQSRVLDWCDKQRHAGENKTNIPVLYLQGGVGSGKSRAMLAPVIEMLLEIPNLRVLWGRNDFKDIKLSIMDKFFEIVPAEIIVKKSEQYHWYDIEQPDNNIGRIYFNGLKDLSGFSSQEFGVILVTEAYEITEQAYRTLKRRCRQENAPNIILMEGEAPNEDHWLARVTDPDNENYDPDIEMWTVDTYENWNNLPEAYKGSLESMPESWKKKYLKGGFGFIPDGAPFYQGFKETLHTRVLTANPHKPLILGWDYGFRHPACVVTQLDAKGRWLILREIMGDNITIDQFAGVVAEELATRFPGIEIQDFGYGDPAGEAKTDKSEETSVEILRAKGFKVMSEPSTYRKRKEIIEGKLGTLINGIPALVVNSTGCKTIVDGFLGGYHYPVIKQGQAHTTIKTESPFHDGFYSHLMNGLEYIAINMFKPAAIKVAVSTTLRRRRYHDITKKGNAGFGFKQ